VRPAFRFAPFLAIGSGLSAPLAHGLRTSRSLSVVQTCNGEANTNRERSAPSYFDMVTSWHLNGTRLAAGVLPAESRQHMPSI
jgi:hypothetical protein